MKFLQCIYIYHIFALTGVQNKLRNLEHSVHVNVLIFAVAVLGSLGSIKAIQVGLCTNTWTCSVMLCNAHLYENVYTLQCSCWDLMLSFSRCFGDFEIFQLKMLCSSQPSFQTISSAVTNAWLLWYCLNSYWSAIIAVLLSDVRR